MAVIQLPDEQAEGLKAKAAAEGLTLEDWLGKLAAPETAALSVARRRHRLKDLISKCEPNAPLSAEDSAWMEDPPAGREAL